MLRRCPVCKTNTLPTTPFESYAQSKWLKRKSKLCERNKFDSDDKDAISVHVKTKEALQGRPTITQLVQKDELEGRKEMLYLTTLSTHFIYCYMASDIWLKTILIVRKETRCRHISYSFRLTARVLLYAPSHRQNSTYHGLCYTSRGALAGTRNSSMGRTILNQKLCRHIFNIW